MFRAENQPVTDLLFWSPNQGKRGQGNSFKTYLKQIREDTNLLNENEIKAIMADRNLWRQRVDNILIPPTGD